MVRSSWPPLTLTFSPSDGEREQQCATHEGLNSTRFVVKLSDDARIAEKLAKILPLPFGRGEGRGEGTMCEKAHRKNLSCFTDFSNSLRAFFTDAMVETSEIGTSHQES